MKITISKKIRGILSFSLLLAFFLFVFHFIYLWANLHFLQKATCKCVALLTPSTCEGIVLHIENEKIWVTKECSGYKSIILLVSLFLATPFVQWKNKVKHLPLVVICGFFINVSRISLGIFIFYFFHISYSVIDTVLLQAFNTMLIFFVWLFLVKLLSKKKKEQKEEEM